MPSPLTQAIDLLDSTALFLESFALVADHEGLPNVARSFKRQADELRKAIAKLNEVEEPV